MKEIIDNLKELGLNSYEAKVYVALLKKYPATGYEVSQIANIPQSRAYDTLKSLAQQQIVTATNSKPITYTPITPQEITKRHKRKMISTLDFLEKNLPSVKDNYTEPVLSISGGSNIREKVIEIVQNAQKEIFLEIWAQDYKFIEPYLLEAYDRGVEIKIVGYNNLRAQFGLVFEHGFSKEIEQSLGGRMIILASDNKEGLVGNSHSNKDETPQVVWTKNTAIVFLIKEFIVHDMYLLDVEENLDEQMKVVYGKGLKALRDKVLGHEYLYRIH